MKKRRLLVLVAVVFASLGAATVPYFLFQEDHAPDRQFTEEQFRRLKIGMTKDEISAILGALPGDYTHGNGDYRTINGGQIVDGSGPPGPEMLDRFWCGYHGMIGVSFDEMGRLAEKSYYHPWPPPSAPPATAWDRIKRWFQFK